VLAQVSADPGLCLSDLIQRTSAEATHDDVHWLIAADAVDVDLYADALPEPDKIHVFLSQERSAAHQRIEGTRQPMACGWVDIAVGSSLSGDGRTWTIVNTSDTRISLAGETNAFTEMPYDTF
jgi:hypothetical protein